MAEVWFYHLEREPVEQVLPKILAGMQARGDRICVQCATSATTQKLSQKLWAMEDVAFVPHGRDGDPAPERQPVWITTAPDNANHAPFRFFVEGALPLTFEGTVRVSIMFDGHSDSAIASSRQLWKKFQAEGHAIRYWRQDENGRWIDRAA